MPRYRPANSDGLAALFWALQHFPLRASTATGLSASPTCRELPRVPYLQKYLCFYRKLRGDQKISGWRLRPPMQVGQRLEAFAENPGAHSLQCAIVIAWIVFAKPNFPMIQMPQ